MAEPIPWSASDDENAAIEALSGVIHAMADLLHQVEDARYIDPSGGHIIDIVDIQQPSADLPG